MRGLFLLLLATVPALAADPVVIAPRSRPTGADTVITVGQAAALSGGDDTKRDRMAKLDLIERDEAEGISRKLIRYRLRLAGFDDADFTFADSLPSVVAKAAPTAPARGQALTVEAVEEAAKAELYRRFGKTPDEVFIDVVKGVAVKLPATGENDAVELVAVPLGGAVKFGQVQVSVAVKVNGERKLTLPVFLQASEAKAGEKPAEVVVKARQQVDMVYRIGELVAGDRGEAMHDAKLGQPIKVKNTTSGKVVSGIVSGPGVVEVSGGGAR